MEQMRLQKYLAEAGVASRRKAEELIRQGRVRIDGAVVTEMGARVSEGNVVEVDGKRILPEEEKVYIMLNKPVGYVSTSKDQFSRAAVVDLVKDINVRLYPVGRLDYDTSGLLLMTNDGEFTYRLTHPKHEVTKTYIAEVMGTLSEEELQRFRSGIRLEGYTTAPAEIKLIRSGKKPTPGQKTTTGKKPSTAEKSLSCETSLPGKPVSVVEIIIHEGKNRQVRKMCEAIGHPVLRLKRVAISDIKLGDLPEGKWRHLSREEIRKLKL